MENVSLWGFHVEIHHLYFQQRQFTKNRYSYESLMAIKIKITKHQIDIWALQSFFQGFQNFKKQQNIWERPIFRQKRQDVIKKVI